MGKDEDMLYEVISDMGRDICLADLTFQSRKICTEKGIEHDPYNVGVAADCNGNIFVYLFSDCKGRDSLISEDFKNAKM